MGGNEIETFPAVITHLTQLEELFEQISSPQQTINTSTCDLRDNELKEIPSEIGAMTTLTRLDIENNYLTSLPKEMSQLEQLGEGTNVNGNYLDCEYLATQGIVGADSTACDTTTQHSLSHEQTIQYND